MRFRLLLWRLGPLLWRMTPQRYKAWRGRRFNKRMHWMTPYLEAAGYEWAVRLKDHQAEPYMTDPFGTPVKGYAAMSFKGVPVALEWHPDGSVTLCKEIVDHIRDTGDVSYLIPPPPGEVAFINPTYNITGNSEMLGEV